MKTPLLALCLLCANLATAQQFIDWTNPSFEGTPTHGVAPEGWEDCGFPGETQPDLHGGEIKQFGVQQNPIDGDTFLGMVVRDNDTWERIGQRLTLPLESGQYHRFSVYISRAEMYTSASRKTQSIVNYTTPCQLRVWGGNAYCDQAELLFESGPVKNSEWNLIDVEFIPSRAYQYLLLEAYYVEPIFERYNGNILLDGLSPIEVLGSQPGESPVHIRSLNIAVDRYMDYNRHQKIPLEKAELRNYYFSRYLLKDLNDYGFLLCLHNFKAADFEKMVEILYNIDALEEAVWLERGYELIQLSNKQNLTDAQVEELKLLSKQFHNEHQLEYWIGEYGKLHGATIMEQAKIQENAVD
ncbi:MAG: hypothetical protein GYB31_08700 [Bacteroidetes bacterium]|nr:hypothetical protein [Bacteroidota bacterium]